MALENDTPITVNLLFKSGTAVIPCDNAAAAAALLATVANHSSDLMVLDQYTPEPILINRNHLQYAFIRGGSVS